MLLCYRIKYLCCCSPSIINRIRSKRGIPSNARTHTHTHTLSVLINYSCFILFCLHYMLRRLYSLNWKFSISRFLPFGNENGKNFITALQLQWNQVISFSVHWKLFVVFQIPPPNKNFNARAHETNDYRIDFDIFVTCYFENEPIIEVNSNGTNAERMRKSNQKITQDNNNVKKFCLFLSYALQR